MTDALGAVHAHELTAADRKFIAELSGAELDGTITFALPSGLRMIGYELQRWIAPAFTPDPATLRWAVTRIRRHNSHGLSVTQCLALFADQFDPAAVDRLSPEEAPDVR